MLVHVLHIDGSVQGCSISIANALEILQSCTNPSICKYFLRMHITSIPLLCAQISYKFLSVVAPFIGLFLQLYDWNKWIWIFLSMRYPKCCMVYSPYALFCCPLFIFFHLTSLFHSAVCMKLNIYTHINDKICQYSEDNDDIFNVLRVFDVCWVCARFRCTYICLISALWCYAYICRYICISLLFRSYVCTCQNDIIKMLIISNTPGT